MKKGDFKVLWFGLALVISLGLFTGSYRLYQDRMIEKPVITKIDTFSNVENVEIEKNHDGYFVEVNIQTVGDIKEDYKQIDKVVNSSIKKNYDIHLVDQRDNELQTALDEFQIEIYEALAKNNYVWLQEQLKDLAVTQNYEYNLYLDEERLYIQLEKGDAFLYEVINRPSQDKVSGPV
ncbi:MAG: hypothetical protein U9N81_14980 [Bacillota bacterium]|nr:hypothetical protein [Bacillota bacterium]